MTEREKERAKTLESQAVIGRSPREEGIPKIERGIPTLCDSENLEKKAYQRFGDLQEEYVSPLDDGDETKLRILGNTTAIGDESSNGTFFRAVLLARRGKYIWCIITICLSQDLAVELSNAKYIPTAIANGVISASSPSVPQLAPVYLKLGTWQWALSLGLDDDSIPEILMAFTHCAKDWAKA